MKLPHSLSALALMALCFLPATASAQDDVKDLVRGNNEFALDLYKQLLQDAEGNAFVSPYSISTALAMTWAGARGLTQEEMAKVLGFDLPPERIHDAYAELLELQNEGQASPDAPAAQARPGDAAGAVGRLQQQQRGQAQAQPATFNERVRLDLNDLLRRARGPASDADAPKGPGYQLSVANALWAEENFEFLPEYFSTVTDRYGAPLEKMSFKTDPDGSRERINRWVEDKTNDKIKDLLKPGTIKPSTRLVLTNAIYFKGSWKTEFNPDHTVDGRWTSADGSTRDDVPLMFLNTDHLRYAETADAQILELPYQGDDLAMTVILPRAADGLAALEESLTSESLNEMIGSTSRRDVQVYLPKFKMTHELELADALSAMGMPSAFEGHPQTDFSGMNGKKDLAISKVIHKAFVEVNEEGTEAAAATAVVVVETTSVLPNLPKIFRADHPFMFLIRDTRNGSILFMGRVTNPKQ